MRGTAWQAGLFAFRSASREHGAVIRVENFHKAYGDTIAVSGLSFDVQAGQILGLLGPNGAGKTTTMRAITGVIPPTSGYLLGAGYDVVRDPIPAQRNLASVPDAPPLFDPRPVWEPLRFTAAASRVAAFGARAVPLLEQSERREKRDTLAPGLPGGMGQRGAFCGASLSEPRAILFDEPLTGL